MFGRWLLQGRCGSSLQLDYPEQREAAEPGHPGRVTALQRAARRPTQETASGKESDPSQGRREEQEAASGGQIWSGGQQQHCSLQPGKAPCDHPPRGSQGDSLALPRVCRVDRPGNRDGVEGRSDAGAERSRQSDGVGARQQHRGSQQQGRENGMSGQLFQGK